MRKILLVGGDFSSSSIKCGKSSGYVEKMYQYLEKWLGAQHIEYLNGGHYAQLFDLVHSDNKWNCVVWMANIDNNEEKLLPYLRERMPDALLIQSKYNGGRYTKADLLDRMVYSDAKMLIEFNKFDNGIKATLIDNMGNLYCDTFDIQQFSSNLAKSIVHRLTYKKPIKDGVIPQAYDAGAFGRIRTKHIHEGVDIYADEGTDVYAMESGIVVSYGTFTGESVGSPWWNDTEYVMIAGASGVINYGEIDLSKKLLHFGMIIHAGDIIGQVNQVLKKDKGLPMSMLHIELYKHGTMMPVKEWALGQPKPENLFDPTSLLVGSGMKFRE